MGEATLLPDLGTEILIPICAAVGIAFAVAQWLLVSKVKLSTSADAAANNGFSDPLVEEEDGFGDHSVVRKCADIQAAISEVNFGRGVVDPGTSPKNPVAADSKKRKSTAASTSGGASKKLAKSETDPASSSLPSPVMGTELVLSGSVDVTTSQVGMSPSEVAKWILAQGQKTADLEREKAELEAEKAEFSQKQLAFQAELVKLQAKVARIRGKKENSECEAKKAKKARAEMQAELESARKNQGLAVKVFVKRLLTSGGFTTMADELAKLTNSGTALGALEKAALEHPGLDPTKFGYQWVNHGALCAGFVAVVEKHLDQLELLTEISSSPMLLTSELVNKCSADSVPELDSVMGAAPSKPVSGFCLASS